MLTYGKLTTMAIPRKLGSRAVVSFNNNKNMIAPVGIIANKYHG
jgi:hypothetical protein